MRFAFGVQSVVRGGLLGVCLMVLAGASSGCVGTPEVEHLRDQAHALRAGIDESLRRGESLLASLPPDDPARARAVASVEELRARRAALDESLAHLDAWLQQEATEPTDPLTRALREAAPLLPAPAGPPLILGGALLVTILRARQLKTALVSVARSIEKAKDEDDVFRARFAHAAPTIRSIQTPAARRIVDEATSEGFRVRLPL